MDQEEWTVTRAAPESEDQPTFWVALFSTLVDSCTAFLFEQEEFPMKNGLYFLMLAPLVIHRVTLAIFLLLFTSISWLALINLYLSKKED